MFPVQLIFFSPVALSDILIKIAKYIYIQHLYAHTSYICPYLHVSTQCSFTLAVNTPICTHTPSANKPICTHILAALAPVCMYTHYAHTHPLHIHLNEQAHLMRIYIPAANSPICTYTPA